MSDFIAKLVDGIFDYAMDISIRKVSEMSGFKQKGGTEILQHLFLNGASFKEECKFTIAGKRDNSLEIIISHPGMKDTICVDANSVEYKGFEKKYKKSIAKYINSHIEIEVEVNPEEAYTFKINFYPDKKIYMQTLKLYKLKNNKVFL